MSSLTQKVIVTTSWDDGHVLDFKVAKLLHKYKLQGTFYVSPHDTEFAQSKLLLNKDIKKLSQEFEIGAHTMTHPTLTELSDADAYLEILNSKKYLEKVIGKKVECFCYPKGKYQNRHVEIVKESGFRMARTTKRFTGRINSSSPFEINTSIHAYRHWSDIVDIIKVAHFNPINTFRYLLNWDLLAIAYYERIYAQGGVFHLWGHSWEIESNNDWGRLEHVFSVISEHRDTDYVSNGSLIP